MSEISKHHETIIDWSNKNLTSLEGCPNEVGGDFKRFENPKTFKEEEIRSVCHVKGRVIVEPEITMQSNN